MKRKLTLLQSVQRLKREEIVRCASNLGVELNEAWSTSQMRKAYADYVLAHPKELLTMLPFEDIRILKPSELDHQSTTRSLINTHVTPIFVQYGLAELDVISSTEVKITIPDDFFQAVAPHLDWAAADKENKGRMEIELAIEGLTNLLGIVTQQDVKKCLIRLCEENITDEEAEETIGYVRQRSLLLDSMEWREHGDETKEEDVLFVSRYGWEDKAAMKLFIEQRAEAIPSPCEFAIEDVVNAALPLSGLMPNEKGADFMGYLAHDLRLDEMDSNLLCFMLWYCKMLTGLDENADQLMESHFLSYGIMRAELEFSEKQLEEAMQRLTDYANHIPLWHLRGFSATDYPSEAYVPMKKAKFKGPLGKELKKMTQEMQWIVDMMKAMTPTPPSTRQPISTNNQTTGTPTCQPSSWANQKIGRNAPCPCGSGKKYKNCCGRGN